MVAARRLRKSMLKEMPNINIDSINDISSVKHKHVNVLNDDTYIKDNLGTFEEDNKKLNKFRLKLIIKIFVSILIIFICLLTKLFFKEQALSNKYIGILISEYKKDYTKVGCIEKCEDVINATYNKTKYIIPEELANKVKNKYLSNIKPYLVEFEVKEAISNIFVQKNELTNNTKGSNNISENTGRGGGEPLDSSAQTMEVPETQEAIAMMDNVEKILNKKIDIKQPVQGTITSKYGNREQIFEGVNSYHTGIDIANKMGTEIKSATSGIVRKTEENNKYYGNNIEIETDGVIFKYAHLNKINVKVEDEVNQDSMIGYMGSTGMSTGPHLHFEIKIDGTAVDPNNILKFY